MNAGAMDERLEALAAKHAAKADEQVPVDWGGPITATAWAVGDVKTFRNGRELAAWLGLVPRQHSTGGREQLLGISKRGDAYVRGYRRPCGVAGVEQADPRSRWVLAVAARRHQNVAVVALANRMARTAYALLAKGEDYQADHVLRLSGGQAAGQGMTRWTRQDSGG